MYSNRKSRTDRKSRDWGRVISVTLHAILLMLLFLPFFSMKAPEVPSKEALVIQFDYPYNQYVAPEKFVEPNEDMFASKMSGSEAGGSSASEEAQHSRPQEAAPTRLAAPSVTSVAQTNSSALRSSIGEIPMPTPNVVTKKAWQSVNDNNSFESDGVEEMKMTYWSEGGLGEVAGSGPGDGDDDSDIWSDGFGTGTGGTGGQGGGSGNQTGTGSGPGGGTGTGGAGKNTGIGQDGNGLSFGEFMGDGLLDRKLLKRANNVGSLAVKAGKVSIFICVDRGGRVISSKYDILNSTINDAAFIAKAEACASSYVFAPDIGAAEKQCGKLAFIFKIK